MRSSNQMACADGIVKPKNEVRSGPPSASDTGFRPKSAGEIPATAADSQASLPGAFWKEPFRGAKGGQRVGCPPR